MPIVPPTQEVPPDFQIFVPPCDCPGSQTLPFIPKFESLSDEDLDICEIIALSILGGASLTWDSIRYAFTLTKCFQCLSARRRREFEIWWVLYLTSPAPCVTSDEMKTLINTIRTKTTLNEREAALTGLRSYVWDYADCNDI